ncbi:MULTISPECIES: PxKF domain-containing protein [unclassified Nocardioides]|uniref:PxKF domain-containing protein n=1 Tax=unclassified Nocardioides TaxID=2615069 RepID=UPI0006F858A4|nr:MULTISPECIES: PxKF domain-containing protein [unclassified Nocardioides]KQY57063.1 hypothetical protein ASD30_12435 [Nocardioides sp. Root140]KRF11703.1 hypothetical protein ASH02_17080 [Nocardioides sp. Soil796]
MRVSENHRPARKQLARASTLTALTMSAALALSGVAVADDITNDLDLTVDTAAEVLPLNVGGANGTTSLYVKPQGGDGKNGCNLTGGTALTLAVSSSDTAVATVSPASVTFTSCGTVQQLTVTPVAEGSATVSATQVTNTSQGSFNMSPATFTVTVAPPANSAPSLSASGIEGGASYAKGAVPDATCEVADNEDGPSSFPATLSAVTGPYAVDGIGTQTASCTYTDGGGLTASASETYSIVDQSAPVITYTLDPATPDGDNDWYRSDVSLTWHVSEPESPGSVALTGCVDQLVTTDQSLTGYTCSATSAGGSAAEQTVSLKRDATAPVVDNDVTVSGTAGHNGWYTSDVAVTFTATDVLSGPASASTTATSSGEGAAIEVASPAFTDAAGNTTPTGAVTKSYKVDKTAPTTPTLVGGPDGSYYYGDDPSAPTCESTDATSGLVDCVVTGGGTSVGTHSYTATATDVAGNSSTSTLTYTVLAWTLTGFRQPVDMGSVWNTVKGGSTVPLKFEVFAGPTELTDTAVVASFRTAKVSCTSGTGTEDPIEILSTGGTSLRYDTTGGQFIQNWKTPTGAGTCYTATMTTQDGSSISARFKLK